MVMVSQFKHLVMIRERLWFQIIKGEQELQVSDWTQTPVPA